MGCTRNNILFNPDQAVGTALVDVMNIPPSACEGEMSFNKDVTNPVDGSEIYIGLGGKNPTATDYHIKLSDATPGYVMDGLIVGPVRAIANMAAVLQTFVPFRG